MTDTSTRRLLIDFDAGFFGPRENGQGLSAEDLGRALNALAVHGLRVIGSAPSDPYAAHPAVRLIFETALGLDDMIPPAIEDLTIVRPTFAQETHGGQRLVRVRSIEPIGRPRVALVA